MGSCISKCKPKKTPTKEIQQEEEPQCIEKNNNSCIVQDKLVISQAPISSPPSKKSSISHPNASSSSSLSSANSNYPATSSSLSSCSFLSSTSSRASSVLSSELDRSVENPHIIRHHDYPITAANSRIGLSLPGGRCYITGSKPNGPREHPSSPQRVAKPTSQKRARCSSPSNLARQKSFRREPDRPIVSCSPNDLAHQKSRRRELDRSILSSNLAHQRSVRRELDRPVSRSSRDLRPISPSPSRRYKGEAITRSMRRETCYVRPHSPSSIYINSRRHGGSKNSVGKTENENMKGNESKLEGLAIGELLSGQEMDWMPIEDVNNPHIALDCFIFL